ncbi:hypothetical protein FDECE_7530 [Fusarium decemcellulare]|nr:hypothetical protein FDECE_7530 [Fusarium decemcellulare]
MAQLPSELQLGYRGGEASIPAEFGELATQDDAMLALTSQSTHDPPSIVETDSDQRRSLQHEIQRIYISISQLDARSYILKSYFDLKTHFLFQQYLIHSIDGHDKVMALERKSILLDLSHVLQSISQQNIEPNGHLLVGKIRRVASTLIQYPPERNESSEIWPEQELLQLDGILQRLDHACTINSGDLDPTDPNRMTLQDEEQESPNWEELSDFQLQI